MADVSENNGECKTGREPYFKLYVDDWLAGTRGLTDEQKGVYIDLLCMMWGRKNGLPNDIELLARHLGKRRQKMRRLVDSLIADGKLAIADGLIINPRMQRDILQRQRASKPGRRALGKLGRSSGIPPVTIEENPEEFAKNATPDAAKSIACTRLPDPDPDPEKKIEGSNDPSAVGAAAPTGKHKRRLIDALSVQTAYNEYNALALRISIPQAAYLTPKRKSSINARLRECGGLVGWRKALANLEGAERLRNMPSGWVPNLDFVVQRSSFAKLLEGAYNGRPAVAAAVPNGHLPAWKADINDKLARMRAANARLS